MDNDSTVTQARFTRRGVLTKTAAGIGTAAAVNAGMEQSDVSGPVGEADAALCGGLCIAGAAVGVAAGGAAVGYLANEAADKYLGDERDYSNYTGADALKTEVDAGLTQMASADERVMTSIQNNVTHSRNVALTKGKAAIIKSMNNGQSESAANTAMADAIDSYFSSIEANILTHYNSQLKQWVHMATQLGNHSNVTPDTVIDWNDSSSNNAPPAEVTLLEENYTLLNGESKTIKVIKHDGGSWGGGDNQWPLGNHQSLELTKDSGEEIITLNRYTDTLDAVTAERDNVNATLSGFVADVYNNYSAGDIPTENLVDPITAATELSQNYDGEQGQGAFAAMLGIPTSAEQSVWLTLETDGVDLVGDIYTEHVPTDGSGTKVGFTAGNTYDPANFTAPVYVAYEADASQGEPTTETATATETSTQLDQQFIHPDTAEQTASDFVEIEQPFTIHKIETPDGSTVDSFQTESRNTQTADVSKLQEELEQIRQAQIDMQEEAQEETGGGGGGGGFLADSSDRELGILALGAAAVVYLLGNN